MDAEKLFAQLAGLEALLFIHGEPITFRKIGKVLDLQPEAVRELLLEFDRRLSSEERGLMLVLDSEKVQLATKPEFKKILEDFVKSELADDLTPASLETLAIISYFGPISRSRIEYQRGVNSIFILRSLLLRGLVERFSDPENQNAYLYRPAFEMLKHLGISKQEDLPEYQKFQSLLSSLEEPNANLPARNAYGTSEADGQIMTTNDANEDSLIS